MPWVVAGDGDDGEAFVFVVLVEGFNTPGAGDGVGAVVAGENDGEIGRFCKVAEGDFFSIHIHE